jgi:hypothetical protein
MNERVADIAPTTFMTEGDGAATDFVLVLARVWGNAICSSITTTPLPSNIQDTGQT